MCGIFAIHGVERPATWRTKAIACSKKLRHRGPDWSGCYVTSSGLIKLMYAEAKRRRISDTGAQPLVSEDGKLILAVNGEIYNYIALRKSFAEGQKFKTHSDCEVILHLYRQKDKELCNLLDGMFSFVLLDESVTPTRIIAARDPIGITTLYQGRSSKNPGAVYFASELKALVDECDDIISFPPGHVYDRQIPSNAISSRLGGRNACRLAPVTLVSISILPNSPDLLAARKAAAFLGTTYDVTTVRASTPMYLLSRKIKAMGVKMVLSGEGSDEIFGGKLLVLPCGANARGVPPGMCEARQNLHTADCLRANKSTMAWGLEARVPFLDKEFLEVAMNIDPKIKPLQRAQKQRSTKTGSQRWKRQYILRKAFDCSPDGKPYLPKSILWRQKEQFSDGVGYSWIDDHAASAVTDEAFANRHNAFPEDTPDTKEGYFYSRSLPGLVPTKAAASTAVRWIPRGDWGCASDPSGRSVSIHNAAYTDTD
ncbi:Asparagine synthase [Rhizoctonia solani]|uniref:asparagine synthase (glutamine-hydrolyzing) n=1 Tax=Rhizoctonia solani TaxID=456999 RepID=A0A8H7IK75_9AGAM|nr:Asparagine synthase [Rhizoctonia solani]